MQASVLLKDDQDSVQPGTGERHIIPTLLWTEGEIFNKEFPCKNQKINIK